jgi:hypothetical protein
VFKFHQDYCTQPKHVRIIGSYKFRVFKWQLDVLDIEMIKKNDEQILFVVEARIEPGTFQPVDPSLYEVHYPASSSQDMTNLTAPSKIPTSYLQ